MRDELVRSAITFLNDPEVAGASLAKRVEFLESKGLTKEEIEEALRQNEQAGSQKTTSTNSNSPVSYSNGPQLPPPLSLPPSIPERDWKDHFIMATVSVGVAYGIYEVSKRYILPMILPATPSSLEADKSALEVEFARTETLLEQLQKDTNEIKEEEAKRKEQFSSMIQEAHDAIETVKGQAQNIESDVDLIKSHVYSIKESLPKAVDKHRELQDKALQELQDELKSLKQLISNRIKTTGSSSGPPPASSVPSFISKPITASSPLPAGASSSTSPVQKPLASSAAPSVPPSFPVPPIPSSSGHTRAPSSEQPSASSPSTVGTSPVAGTTRPGIPAWQLAATSASSSS
ncbi:Pex14p [Sugiyamaella lignohabitans]|uniref:Peroxisomal membrane protein PEX14 n=1 Tax=Sugiyamaella lignohabitans TaxID=796027 RepID=A0A167D065_9ASCO|nr:Pex14p [Sugiyamaella lignohabitans]ANB12315.1 Pex14p [Sugiyamaella lignohabitans]